MSALSAETEPRAGGQPPASRELLVPVLVVALAAAALLADGVFIGLQGTLILVILPALAGLGYLMWQADPAYVVCVAFFLSPFAGNWKYMHFPSGVDPDRFLLLFAIAQVLFRAPKVKGRPPFRWTPAHVFMGLAVIYAAISAYLAGTLLSKDPLFKLTDDFGVTPFLIFLIAPVAFDTARKRSALLFTMVAMGLYLGLTTLFETAHLNALVFPRYILNPHVGYHYGRGRGPFVDAVANGFALAVCAIACGVARMNWSQARARHAATAVGLLAILGAFMSLERSVWLGAGLGILVMLLVTRQLRRFLVPTLALGAIVLVAALAFIPSLSSSVSARANAQGPIWDRENLLTAGFNMLSTKPLTGFGWQTFQTKSRLYFQQSQDFPLTATTFVVHNFLLGYAVDLGLIGLLLWITAVALGVGSSLLTRGPPDLVMWRAGLVALAIMFVVVADSIPPSEFPNLSLWVWAGIVYSGRYAARRRSGARPGDESPVALTRVSGDPGVLGPPAADR
jgi:O-antigen ligase